MDEIVKGIVSQVIKCKDKENYMLTNNLNNSKDDVIVVKTHTPKGFIEKVKYFYTRSDKFTKVLVCENTNLKEGDAVELAVKPFWVKTNFFKIEKVIDHETKTHA